MLLEERCQLEGNHALNELRNVVQVRDWPVTLQKVLSGQIIMQLIKENFTHPSNVAIDIGGGL